MTQGSVLDDAAWASPWRTRAVRDKAVLSLGLVLVALFTPAFPGSVLVVLAATALILGPAAVRVRTLLTCMTAPATFLVVGAVSAAVSLRWDGGPRLGITDQTASVAAGILGHGLAGTLAMMLLATTTPMVDLLAAMRRLRVPAVCIDIAGLVYRLFFSLVTTIASVSEAQAGRLGYAGWRVSLRSASALAAGVFIRTWDRARRMEEGLAGRGYADGLTTLDPARHSSPRFVAWSLTLLGGITLVSAWGTGATPWAT